MSADSTRSHADAASALPPGTRLGEFELLSIIGVGGFGIVYLAFDHALEREVAVKEYMPAALAGRTETMHVSLRSKSDAETFALGLRSFVNEARLLARFDHPSLLKVHRFWEANGTAYMAMPVMRGRTVKEVRQDMAMPPDEAWLRALLEPLLGAIDRLHSEGVYHRDIAPDNIQVEPDGHPVLLDFGAARRVISDKTQTLTAILKPAYAPIEQYAEAGSVKQGPWTDLYALGATLHYLLLGRPPAPATARAVHDDATPLAGQSLPGCSETFLQTIDWMLAPRPADRPQSVAELREVLEGHRPPPRPRAPAPASDSQWDRTIIAAPPTTQPPQPVTAPPAVTIPLGADDEATVVVPPPGRAATAPRPAPPAPPTPAPPPVEPLSFSAPPVGAAVVPPRKSSALPIGVGLGVLAVAAAAAVALWPRGAADDAAPTAASTSVQPGAQPVDGAAALVPPAASAALPAVLSAASAAAAAASAAAPESTIRTVVVPAPAPPPVRIEAPPPPVTATPRPAPAVPAQRPPPPRPQPASAVLAAPVQTPAPEPAPPPVAVTPAPAPVVPPPAPAPAPAPDPVPAVIAGPEARCAGRNIFSHFACMERECLRSQFQSHPDCLAWRKSAINDPATRR
ncbi:MAG: serine/threonine protein kinase [Rubrivivax sp.]|nr:serine/threonine protein kinase [Rubrivivax sp.]